MAFVTSINPATFATQKTHFCPWIFFPLTLVQIGSLANSLDLTPSKPGNYDDFATWNIEGGCLWIIVAIYRPFRVPNNPVLTSSAFCLSDFLGDSFLSCGLTNFAIIFAPTIVPRIMSSFSNAFAAGNLSRFTEAPITNNGWCFCYTTWFRLACWVIRIEEMPCAFKFQQQDQATWRCRSLVICSGWLIPESINFTSWQGLSPKFSTSCCFLPTPNWPTKVRWWLF